MINAYRIRYNDAVNNKNITCYVYRIRKAIYFMSGNPEFHRAIAHHEIRQTQI